MPEFDIYYEKILCTWNQDVRSKGKVKLTLEKRPTKPEEKHKIERKLENDFLDQFRRQRRNIADIRYKITKVVAVK